MAEKENERRQHEGEAERRRAEYNREMSILAANKVEAMANAKLKAIEESIREEEEDRRIDLPEDDDATDTRQRVQTWVHTITPAPGHETKHGEENGRNSARVDTTGEALAPPTKVVGLSPKNEHFRGEERKSFVPDKGLTGDQPVYRPLITSTPKEAATSQYIEMFTRTNQQLVAGLAKQFAQMPP